MSELISKELLSGVLGSEVEELRPKDDYLEFEYVIPTTKYEAHIQSVNLDTLDRLCKEWCIEQGAFIDAYYRSHNTGYVAYLGAWVSSDKKSFIEVAQWVYDYKNKKS